jgi:hypothetical protein
MVGPPVPTKRFPESSISAAKELHDAMPSVSTQCVYQYFSETRLALNRFRLAREDESLFEQHSANRHGDQY